MSSSLADEPSLNSGGTRGGLSKGDFGDYQILVGDGTAGQTGLGAFDGLEVGMIAAL